VVQCPACQIIHCVSGETVLRIYVLSQDGAAPAVGLSAVFGEGQGSIGRDAHNTLVLPDPHKHISRVQAQIKVENGACFLVDQGANPTSVNGRPLGKGSVAALHDGDCIEMAEWVLRVEEQAARPVLSVAPAVVAFPTTGSDPLGLLGGASSGTGSDPLGLFGGGAVAAPPATVSAPAAFSAPPLVSAADSRRAGASNPDDPFAVFVAAEKPVQQAGPDLAQADPFAAFAPPTQPSGGFSAASSVQAGGALGLGIGAGGNESSVDSLFGLGSNSASYPFGQSALADPASQAPVAGDDPLALLMGASAMVSQPAMRQDSPLLSDAFVPPQSVPVAERDIALTDLRAALPPTPNPPQAAQAAAAPPVPGVAQDALLAAFLRGVAMPGLNLQGGMTEELAEHLGGLLREAVQGTVDLLAARAVTKREMKAEMTMIVNANNNPLKFSPDVGFALHLLFQQQARHGFMGPVEAMQDAYDDLRAHQIGFVAGMRAALEGVLGRFRPDELESRLSDKSFLDSVLPGNRKARLWDLYEQRYVDVLREAEDDFNSLFGREFLRAYEEQIDNLKKDRAPGQ
jgi:FHA domain-containing protein